MPRLITLVGLGPAGADLLSMAARDALRAARLLYLRTAVHPAAQDLRAEDLRFETFDALYESAESFDEVYAGIANHLLEKAAESDLTYAVPGHPLVAEESVRILLERGPARGVEFRVVGSSSFIEPVLAAVGAHAGEGFTLADALGEGLDAACVLRPLLVCQIYDRQTAAQVKLDLLRHYPDDWAVKLVRAAGGPDQRVAEMPLHRLDRAEVDHLTTLYVPPLPESLRRKRFGDLVYVMSRLRGEGGCPWDREQNHQTLKRYLIEECYETLDAIDSGDPDALCEELGDVLLQVVFHAQLTAEEGVFTIDDVIQHIVEKLIRRHPHVFGGLDVADSEEVLRNWERIKREEKGATQAASALDGIPRGLPALMRALEASKRAAKVGFEWEQFEHVLAKLHEEVAELREAVETGSKARVAEEVGDLLFTVVNVARWQGVDPEEALRTMAARFEARFRTMESAAAAAGRSLRDLSAAELDRLWEDAKLRERSPSPG